MFARSRALRALTGGAPRHVDGLIARAQSANPRCFRCLAPSSTFHTNSRLYQVETAAGDSPVPSPSAYPSPPKSAKRRPPTNKFKPVKTSIKSCIILADDASTLEVYLEGSKTLRVPASWLRDRCPQSVSPSSGNKSFATAEIPLDIEYESIRRDNDGNWEVTWRNNIPRFAAAGQNTSVFTPRQLTEPTPLWLTKGTFPELQEWPSLDQKIWDRSQLVLREISYADWMAGGGEFAAAVLDLHLSGLVIIKDVPKDHESVKALALKFGAVKETFYGNTWDVISKPQAENVAYTSEYLGLHSDMLYLDSPPKLQFLHCLQNDAVGGESLFSDAMRTASEMVKQTPDMAQTLAKESLGWHYDANDYFYQQSRPVFEGLGEIEPDSPEVLAARETHKYCWPEERPKNVWWSPPFQTPIRMPQDKHAAERYRKWLAAASTFQNMLEDEANMVRRRLQAGDCVVFDNRRVLHGRTAFDPFSGGRHLRGAYVGIDEWRSTLEIVKRDYDYYEFLQSTGHTVGSGIKSKRKVAAPPQEDQSAGAEASAQ